MDLLVVSVAREENRQLIGPELCPSTISVYNHKFLTQSKYKIRLDKEYYDL